MRRWLLIVLIALNAACASEYSGKTSPAIVDGTIDLTDWDFEVDGPIKLDGEWLFAWEKLVTPASWDVLREQMPRVVTLPSRWVKTSVSLDEPDTKLPGIGFATYGLRLKVNSDFSPSIRWKSQISASRLYLLNADGEALGITQSGLPGTDHLEEVPQGHREFSLELPTSLFQKSHREHSEYILLLQVSSFQHARGGAWNSLRLMSLETGRRDLSRTLFQAVIMLGILLIVALMHLVLYALRREDRAALYFGLFCVAMFVRLMVMGGAQFIDLGMSTIGYGLLIRFEYASMPLVVIPMMAFLNDLVPSHRFNRYVVNYFAFGFGALLIVYTVVPASTLTANVTPYLLYILLTVVFTLAYLVFRAFRGDRLARWLLLASAILAAGAINDMIYAKGIFNTVQIAPYTTLIFILSQSGIIAARSAAAHRKSEHLTENLEQEVRIQTQQLKQEKEAAEMARTEVQKLNDYITESVLKRYLPPALIGDILSGDLSMEKPAELRDITVLFSDLKGFTKTSEDLGPESISAFLNEYLTVMNEVIFEHGGTIDKFIGDAIMVLFGAPQDMQPEEQIKRATYCAKAMQHRMLELTNAWKNDGAGHLRMRIGIHHGSAVVGNFGSTQRSDYTAIGPCVNMAARIESASEPGEVFVSEATAKLMGEGATAKVGAFELKGIDDSVILYRVL